MTVIGALSSFRELGEMSPHKCAYRHRTTNVFGWPETGFGENPWMMSSKPTHYKRAPLCSSV